MDDTTEVERLRARVAELEAQLDTRPASTPPGSGRRTSSWWAVGSAALIILACVLAPLSVASVWASTTLSDTDRYVATVSPLAEDPGVQKVITNRVTTTIFDNLDVEGLTTDALRTLADRPNVPPRVATLLPGLAVPITNGVESFTRTQVGNLVASPQFAQLWDQVNRVAHQQVVKLLEGNQGGAISAQGNAVTLNLGPIIAQVKDRLVARGFSLADNIPTVNKQFVLVQSSAVTKAQGFYSLLNTLGVWLPVVALVLFGGGVALARDRRRAVLRGALGVAAAMVLLGVALAVARSLYVGSTPGNVLPPSTAGDVYDTLVRFLRSALRATAVAALVVAVAAFLTGPSTAAVRGRSALGRGIGSLRGSAEAAGWQTGRVGSWTYTHKRALRITATVVAGLVLVLWSRPTAWVVLGTVLVLLVVLALIEFLGRPPVVAAAQPAATPAGTPQAGTPQAGAPETAAGAGETSPTLPRQVPRETPTTPQTPAEQGSEQPR